MSHKVNKVELDEKLNAFAEALGLEWFPNIEELHGNIDREFLPIMAHREIIQMRNDISDLRADLNLLMEHLGLEVKITRKRIGKRKKGKE
jgi:predicted amino acid-binding ACT domain protein